MISYFVQAVEIALMGTFPGKRLSSGDILQRKWGSEFLGKYSGTLMARTPLEP